MTLLDRIGDTPLVPLTSLTRDLAPGVRVLGKCEWFNPGGSVKDRAAHRNVTEARASGALRDGMRILDASSGNTGIAYAWIGRALGHPLTLCLPRNANAERKRTLKAYGVELVLTSPLEGSDGAIVEARRLAAEDPETYFYADQYSNDANWRAHLDGTGPEIWRDTQGEVTHFVAALGTTGTFIGTSRFLKPRGVTCIAVQPDSPFHGLEGLKHLESALVPAIWQPEGLLDHTMWAPSEESFAVTRALARDEGLLAGISSGAAVWAALEFARTLENGTIVVMLPDGGDRYLSEPHVWEEE
ncbi:MAG: cysteine synthase family protein [Proteobacteria bacterium]|nr:cysteine synthase family protein [Pseudomonadota bacterium]MCP4918838.1 cysteine synthase family protein [Pseudomonadota bacterium]